MGVNKQEQQPNYYGLLLTLALSPDLCHTIRVKGREPTQPSPKGKAHDQTTRLCS